LVPAFGVYAVWVYVDGKRFKGMMDIGRRPTLRVDTESSIEVNILNFEGNLYGKEICIEFIKLFRQEITFPDVEALAAQLMKDRDYVDKFLN
jgi:riboflavin kinase/FMN adenylyltransferase